MNNPTAAQVQPIHADMVEKVRGFYKKGSGWKAHPFMGGMQNPGRPKGGGAEASRLKL